MKISSIRWGVIWIGVGLFFLGINLQLLDTLVFPRLFSLWPILLIAIGVELIFRRTRFYFLAFISPLIIAAAFIFAAYAQGNWGWDTDRFWGRWAWQVNNKKSHDIEIPSDSAVASLDIELQCGIGDIMLKSTSGRLFAANAEYYKRSPWIEHSKTDSVEKIEYVNREKKRFAIFGVNASNIENEFFLADHVPIRAKISTEGNEADLDFSDIELTDISLASRSDATRIAIGDRIDSVNITISGQIGELEMILPDDYGLLIDGKTPRLGKLLIDSDLNQTGEKFISEDYERNRRKIIIHIDAIVGSILFDDALYSNENTD